MPPQEPLRESMERIQAIALVHDLLSYDADVRTVDLRALAEGLIPIILATNGIPPEAVSITLLVPHVALSSRKATAVALILNELVNNAIKHSLGDRDDAAIQIRLTEQQDGLMLQVRDNGPGLPPGFDLATDAHLGLQVVRTLTEQSLSGIFTLTAESGVLAQIWFPW